MASDGASGSRSAGPSKTDDITTLMKELGLREEDLDDVVFDEDEAPPTVARWIALVRVHTPKSYNQFWFFKNMRVAWDLAQEV